MEPELLLKIRQTLSDSVNSEQAVVYLLVEVRKLADRSSYPDQHLRMYCNWVVHTELSNKAVGSTFILKTIDDEIARSREIGRPLKSSPLFRFGTFRDSLRKLLAHFNLPTDLCDEKSKWRPFIILYSAVISECPIRFSASKEPLKFIKSIELKKSSTSISFNGTVVPRLKWKLTFKDESIQHISAWGDNLTFIGPREEPSR